MSEDYTTCRVCGTEGGYTPFVGPFQCLHLECRLFSKEHYEKHHGVAAKEAAAKTQTPAWDDTTPVMGSAPLAGADIDKAIEELLKDFDRDLSTLRALQDSIGKVQDPKVRRDLCERLGDSLNEIRDFLRTESAHAWRQECVANDEATAQQQASKELEDPLEAGRPQSPTCSRCKSLQTTLRNPGVTCFGCSFPPTDASTSRTDAVPTTSGCGTDPSPSIPRATPPVRPEQVVLHVRSGHKLGSGDKARTPSCTPIEPHEMETGVVYPYSDRDTSSGATGPRLSCAQLMPRGTPFFGLVARDEPTEKADTGGLGFFGVDRSVESHRLAGLRVASDYEIPIRTSTCIPASRWYLYSGFSKD
jgi:hypothetical protein